MKTLNSLLGVAVTAVLLSAAGSTRADEPFLSPRAKANQIRVVPGSSINDPNLLANRPTGNAKAWVLAQSLRTVPGTGRDIDLAHAPRPAFSPKDPRYEVALRENALQQFQLAPIK